MHNITPSFEIDKTMNSREIAELCEKQHKNVLRDIRNIISDLLAAGDSADGFIESTAKDEQNQPRLIFELTYSATMILVSGYMVSLRSRIIHRWEALETEAEHVIPQTLPEALRFAAELEEQRVALAIQVERDAPKVSFYDAVVQASDCHTLEEVAKLIGTGRTRLTRWLRGKHVFQPNSTMPYQKHIDVGYFKVVETPWRDKLHAVRLSAKTLVTGKGLAKLQKEWAMDDHKPADLAAVQ